MWETQVQSLGWEDLLEKEMATHSSTLAWRIPWLAESGRLQSMGSQRLRQDWATSLSLSFKCFVTCLLLPFRLFVCNFLSFLLRPSWNQEWLFFFFPKFSTQQSLAYFLRLIFNVNFPDHTVTIKHLFFRYLGELISNSISSSYYVLFYTFTVLLIQSFFPLPRWLKFQLCCYISCYYHTFSLKIMLLTIVSLAWHCCSVFYNH